jgi:hypothetical protein
MDHEWEQYRIFPSSKILRMYVYKCKNCGAHSFVYYHFDGEQWIAMEHIGKSSEGMTCGERIMKEVLE